MGKRYRISKEGANMLAKKMKIKAKSEANTPTRFKVADSDDVKLAIVKSNKKHSKMMRLLAK